MHAFISCQQATRRMQAEGPTVKPHGSLFLQSETDTFLCYDWMFSFSIKKEIK